MVSTCLVFKWFGYPVFKCHSKTRLFGIQPLLDHLNTELVQFQITTVFGSSMYLTLIPVDVLFAIWSQSLDSLWCLIYVSFGENILWLVLEWIFLRISEHEPVQETHQGEVGQRIAGIFDLKCNKLML